MEASFGSCCCADEECPAHIGIEYCPNKAQIRVSNNKDYTGEFCKKCFEQHFEKVSQ